MKPVFLVTGLLLATSTWAQDGTPVKGIYSCTTADGRRLTSDRPIPECAAREQRMLNADGSQRSTLPPFLSPEERAAKDAADRRATADRLALADVARRDRTLMQRYPNEATHQRARSAALDDTNKAMHLSERRIKELGAERKPLAEEAEFYKGKPLPAKLKQALDANDASVEAQQVLIENQKAEVVRLNTRFDAELARLRKLWAGAAPGSMPPLEELPATLPTQTPKSGSYK